MTTIYIPVPPPQIVHDPNGLLTTHVAVLAVMWALGAVLGFVIGRATKR